ncbi:MAG: arsenate reductase family protein [Flavobacterium psychrophilum]|jgi:arsenate reductase
MKNTVFYLPSCDSCRKIVKAISPKAQLVYHDIKQDPLTELQLQELQALAGSYEVLFSRKAQLYKAYNLKNQTLTEADYKKYLLEHYTFLARPVFVIQDQIYVGNRSEIVAKALAALAHE